MLVIIIDCPLFTTLYTLPHLSLPITCEVVIIRSILSLRKFKPRKVIYSILKQASDRIKLKHNSNHTLKCCLSTYLSFLLNYIGEGNGNLLQYSCLENPKDGGACWAAVYGVAQSRTRLKRLSSTQQMLINTGKARFPPDHAPAPDLAASQ